MEGRFEHWLSLAGHEPLAVLLDLDGTLIPFAATPAEARPGPDILALLARLAALPGLSCVVVSGRPRAALAEMFDATPGLTLVAEHGAWRKGGGAWAQAAEVDEVALDDLAARLGALVNAHAGALLERKTASVCAHYRLVRGAERESFLAGASALLGGWLHERPGFERLEVIEAIEVRARHVHKGSALPWVRNLAGAGVRCVALGDDMTDEDTFAALGSRDDAVLVGPGGRPTLARWRLDDPAAAREFLRWLVAVREGGAVDTTAALPKPIA
ncbi:MAG: trehalose-phosphatase [Polyangiaceae bacterium]|nr:trehalose-phosphatase [Polyangiaceae bacterium]